MSGRAFVYTELQILQNISRAPWKEINAKIRNEPGFINKTWLQGVETNSLGGLYTFDSIENAQKFVTGYFPSEARNFGVAQTTRVFDADTPEEASRDMNSVHFGGKLSRTPGAFLYTEIQVHVPFSEAPWKKVNPIIKAQPGFLAKTWLYGVNANTLGGLYAFETIENAKHFALNQFAEECANLNAAFYTRIFDASVAVEPSKDMRSPFYV